MFNSKKLVSVAMALSMMTSLGMSPAPAFMASISASAADAQEDSQNETAKQRYFDMMAEAEALSADDYSADSYAAFQYYLNEYSTAKFAADYNLGYEFSAYDYNKFCIGIEYAKSFLNTDKTHQYIDEFEEVLGECEEVLASEGKGYTEESYAAFYECYVSKFNYRSRYTMEGAAEAEGKGKGFSTVYEQYIINLRHCFNLLVREGYEASVKEDEATGAKLYYNGDVVPEDCVFSVDKFDSSNWAWEGLNSISFSKMENLCSQYEFYSFNITDADGNRIEMTKQFTVTLPVPEYFDMDSLTVELYKNSHSKGAIGKISTDKENRLITVTFSSESWLFSANGAALVLKNPVTAIDPLTLKEDGVYSIHPELTTYSSASQASMANSSLVHDDAYLVKDGENLDVYLNFVPLYIFGPDVPSYCGGLWSERGKSGDNDWYFDSETVLSYYTNDDGTIKGNEIYNGVTEIPCIKSIKLRLQRDCYNEFGGYTLVVSSPAMAAMNNLKFEEIIMDQLTCNLMISEPEYLGTEADASSLLPTYDYSALKRELQYADTLNAADYTAESWQAIETALKNAKAVDNNSDSVAIKKSVNEFKAAVSGLVIDENKNNNLADGRYLLNADMIQTDRETKSMSDNAINHTVTLDVVDGEYYVNVEFKSLTIGNDFGYLSKLSYYDTGYSYNQYGIPQGELKQAETLTSYDVVDMYNTAETPYPHYMRFKLVDKASGEDGYVPLQVFVPIMENIQEGNGTQNVLMKLDWSTLREAGAPSELNGYSISLSGDIGLNFFMNLSEEVLNDSGAKVRITLPDGSTKDIPVNSVTAGENGYQFTADVAAKEMTENVTAQVLLSNGTKGEIYTYSVKQYADELLADNSVSDKTKALVKAMLNYGGYAQEYFSYNTANLASADLTDAEKSLDAVTEDELSFCEYTLKGSDTGISYKGSKLSLESKTAIKHYFALAEGAKINDYTFKVGGNVATPVKSGDMYYVTVENISAQNLATDYAVQVGKLRLTYSPMSYAYSALTKTDKTALQNVVKALYLYNQAADSYVNS